MNMKLPAISIKDLFRYLRIAIAVIAALVFFLLYRFLMANVYTPMTSTPDASQNNRSSEVINQKKLTDITAFVAERESKRNQIR